MTIPRNRSHPAEVYALRKAVKADMQRVDEAARSWSQLGAGLTPTEVSVLGRGRWVEENLRALRGVFDPLAAKLDRKVATRAVSVQIGALLGLMSSRVLGQYILPLAVGPAAPKAGRLVVVGPNLLSFGEPDTPIATGLRRAVLIHETTHRLQFEGVEWMAEHLRGLLQRYLGHARLGADAVRTAMGRLPHAVRQMVRTRSAMPVLQAVLSPDQLEIVTEAQGLMSLLEGHGMAAMYQADPSFIGDVEGVRASLRRRRQDPMARLLSGVAGLEMKQRQYREGEGFVDAVVGRGGVRALNQAFSQPDLLPSHAEIQDPDAWLDRIG